MGISLIAAIGAQNALVLRQGIRREHVLPLVLLCVLADAALIALGILGIGAVIENAPVVLIIVRYAGAAFLLTYGILAARRAFKPNKLTTETGGAPSSLWAVIGTGLALTFLNPHVYLDTVLLLGSIATSHGDGRWIFGAGAILASFVWFFALGYGSRALSTLFEKPMAWRVLDGIIAAVMITLALQLVLTA